MYRQSEKKLVKRQYVLHMVNFGLLAAEICWRVWGTPANFNGFRVFVGLYLRNRGTYRQWEKKLLNSNVSPTCRQNMMHFGPLAAEICWRVWGTPAHFNGCRVLAALLHSTLVAGVSQTLRR